MVRLRIWPWIYLDHLILNYKSQLTCFHIAQIQVAAGLELDLLTFGLVNECPCNKHDMSVFTCY